MKTDMKPDRGVNKSRARRRDGALAVLPVLVLLSSVAAAAMPPGQINFQGVLRDATNTPENGTFDMVFRFHDAATLGNELLVDSHLAVGTGAIVVTDGLFTVKLGSGTITPGGGLGAVSSLVALFATFDTVWVEINIDPAGLNETLLPRIRVVAAAYALNAANLGGKAPAEFLDTSASSQTKAGDLTVNNVTAGGTITGNGSGLSGVTAADANLLDGQDSTAFLNTSSTFQTKAGSLQVGGSLLAGGIGVAGVISIGGGNPAEGRVLTSNFRGDASWTDLPSFASVTGRPAHSLTSNASARFSSITIGIDALPVSSSVSPVSGELFVTHCDTLDCTSSTVTSVDNLGSTFSLFFTSIAIGVDGLPIIAYGERGGFLRIAHCADVSCSSASITNLTVPADSASITIGSDGLPVIARAEPGGGSLFVSHCANATCSATDSDWKIGPVGEELQPSITVGVDGLPIVSYRSTSIDSLLVTHCQDLTCSTSTSVSLPTGVLQGFHSSIAIGVDGLPVISFYDSLSADLRLAHCPTLDCFGGTSVRTVDSGNVGEGTSLTIGDDGLPIISYHDAGNAGLKVAHCGSVDCSTSSTTTMSVGVFADHGRDSSITIGVDGLPVISYFDGDRFLLAAHCGNRFCVPNHRPR